MEKKRVFIADKLNEDALELLRGYPEIEVDYRPGLSVEQKLEAVSRANALIVRSSTQVDAPLLDRAEMLKLVEEGMNLHKACKSDLDAAEGKLRELSLDEAD